MNYKQRKSDYPLCPTVHYENFREMVLACGERYGDRPAFSYRVSPHDVESHTLSFRQVAEDVSAYATALIAHGFRGKKVALIGENSYTWIYSYLALASIGAIVVPVDKEYPAADMASILNTARCDLLVASPALGDKLDYLRENVPSLGQVVLFSGEGDATIHALIAEGQAALAAGDTSYFDYEIDPDALLFIVFTSGTTGKGKGVMLTTRNILTDLEHGIALFDLPEKTFFVLPAHHTFASTANLLGHYGQGIEIYISHGPRYIVNEIKAENPTHLMLVPLYVETFYKKIFAAVEKQGKLGLVRKMMKLSNALRKVGIDLREKLFGKVLATFGTRMRMIICGGAALSQQIIDDLDALGITILNGYGITECAPLISCNRNNYRKAGSVGRPIAANVLKIDTPNEHGEGEICVKGTNVMLGYFEDEGATAAVFDDEGYFHTGDLGRLDEEGWIYITGRLKNLIILSNGKNVYPEELETAIAGIYGVSEVVVYAGESRSDASKELIVAEIFPDAEALQMRDITDYDKYFHDEIAKLNGASAPYKKIGHVKLRTEEFPKTTTRKITRFKIDKTID